MKTITMKEALGELKQQYASEAQQRLDDRRYIVRVIDARDDWTKCVTWKDTLTASKRKAVRFDSLKHAVEIRNLMNKSSGVKSAWIIFE